jgi:hypothetical protein
MPVTTDYRSQVGIATTVTAVDAPSIAVSSIAQPGHQLSLTVGRTPGLAPNDLLDETPNRCWFTISGC